MWVRIQAAAGVGGEQGKGIPIYGIHKGERRKGNEREGGREGGKEKDLWRLARKIAMLHVASQTIDMGNGEANTEPVGVGF